MAIRSVRPLQLLSSETIHRELTLRSSHFCDNDQRDFAVDIGALSPRPWDGTQHSAQLSTGTGAKYVPKASK
jgi:hypothetical protein